MQLQLLGAIWLSGFLVSIDYTALNVALPTLATGFGVGTSEVSWIALAYMLVMVALTLVTGPVINRLGYLRALTCGLAVFAAASLASALTSTFWLLVAMRAVQGIGASVMFVIGPVVIKTLFPEQAHDRAFAIYSTGPTAGLCAGPAIGGQLTAMFGWKAVFLFNLPATILALLLLHAAARETSGADRQAPHPGAGMPNPITALLAVLGLLTLLLALNRGPQWGWSSPGIVTLFLTAGVALIAVVLIERQTRAPLIDRRIFASTDFSTSALVFLLVLMVFGGSVFLMPFYFELLRKMDTKSVGHLMVIQPIATIIVANIAGFCLARTGRRSLCLIGIALLVGGVAMFASMDRDSPRLVAIGALFLMGAGAGLYYPTLIQASMAGVPLDLAAAASSLQTAVRVMAQLFGVALFEAIFSQLNSVALDTNSAAATTGATATAMQFAFHSVFWCGAAIAALALLPAFMLARSAAPPDPTNQPGDREEAA
jgi:EmrB/QacA subfamily drug resistance transporter